VISAGNTETVKEEAPGRVMVTVTESLVIPFAVATTTASPPVVPGVRTAAAVPAAPVVAVAVTVASWGSPERVKLTDTPSMTSPFWSFTVAVRLAVSERPMVAAELARVMVVTTGVVPVEPPPPVPPVVVTVLAPESGPPAFPLLEQPANRRGNNSATTEAICRV